MTKANGRKPLNIELSDDDRLLLDGVRARLGLRSLGDAVRALIGYAAKGEVPPGFEYVPVAAVQALPDVRSTAPIPPKASLSGVQLGPPPAAPGSRLKQPKPKR